MLLSGADIIIRTLIEQGVDTVFGYPGGQILHVYDSLYKYRDEIHHILTAHEQGAAHAADGYARTTGKVGVVISTSGPGATNLVTGIATAHLDSVPLVAICGNVPTTQIGTDSFQEIDITGITLPITKHNYFVNDVTELADTIREAFRLALSGRPGPVLVDVPKDVQMAECEYTVEKAVEADEPMASKYVRIREAAEIINDSRRPYIYFGGGMISAEAQNEMLTLAERIDAPMGCSLMGISGLPTDMEGFLGMQGMHGRYASSVAIRNADVIISMGVRFSDRATGDRRKFAWDARIVHIDVDGSELSKTVAASVGLRGDIKQTLKALLPLIKESKKPEWLLQVRSFREEEEIHADKRDGLTPKNAIRTVNRFLGENTAVATDVGQHQMWSAQELFFRTPRRFLTSGGLGTMGYGLGAAIGAYYGTGERSVLITGDGSFGMSINELATAVTYKIPVVIVIMNNGVLGMVRQWQTFFFDKHYSNTVLDRRTDFISVAKGFGADGVKVSTVEELNKALKRGFETDGPFVIECLIDKDELVLPMMPPGGTMNDMITEKGNE